MNKFILVCGPFAAGKTDFANKNFKKINNCLYIDIDDYYKKYNPDYKSILKPRIWLKAYSDIYDAGLAGKNVILNTAAVTKANRDELFYWFGELFSYFEMYFIYADEYLRNQNNKNRERSVPLNFMIQNTSQIEVPEIDINENPRWNKITLFINENNKKYVKAFSKSN